MAQNELSLHPKLGRSTVVWGFVSQAASSATNFALSLLAGWQLGPAGLGQVFVGFSCYLAVLGFQRALITDPFVATSSDLGADDRRVAARAAITASMLLSASAAVLLGLAGLALGSGIGNSLFLFALWLVPVLLQDVWRVVLFRDRREKAGAVNDLIWLLVMALTAPLALATETRWAIIACWGVGGLVGALAGFMQTRLVPLALRATIHWWHEDAVPLGRWLAAEGVVYLVGSQGTVFLLASILGASSIGGLRAVESLFAPLSLLGPALALPMLPELTRRVTHAASSRAISLARKVTLAALGSTCAYVAASSFGNGRLLVLVYGDAFEPYRVLILPVAVRQIVGATTPGYYLLLKARRQGHTILASRVVETVSVIVASSILGASYGVVAAAWGIALGHTLRAAYIVGSVLKAERQASGVVATGRPEEPTLPRINRMERGTREP